MSPAVNDELCLVAMLPEIRLAVLQFLNDPHDLAACTAATILDDNLVPDPWCAVYQRLFPPSSPLRLRAIHDSLSWRRKLAVRQAAPRDQLEVQEGQYWIVGWSRDAADGNVTPAVALGIIRDDLSLRGVIATGRGSLHSSAAKGIWRGNIAAAIPKPEASGSERQEARRTWIVGWRETLPNNHGFLDTRHLQTGGRRAILGLCIVVKPLSPRRSW
eukprot:gnl/TRDRNA2_/TRDRNA2_169318_c0_seq3.p1 gnl/TRDRNA2_/TRDRNA2_169318_c0~~gnl/TRDRNA2_/TRDRNA2_169318_c0_seq3.p1  ORF type:complete len:216 (-),score=26.28 gnl/TRDRNA2_/TRDRNA2_169318_c0_seq3:231-878(-)